MQLERIRDRAAVRAARRASLLVVACSRSPRRCPQRRRRWTASRRPATSSSAISPMRGRSRSRTGGRAGRLRSGAVPADRRAGQDATRAAGADRRLGAGRRSTSRLTRSAAGQHRPAVHADERHAGRRRGSRRSRFRSSRAATARSCAPMRQRRCATRWRRSRSHETGLARLAGGEGARRHDARGRGRHDRRRRGSNERAKTLQIDAKIVPVAGLSHRPAAAVLDRKVDVFFGDRVVMLGALD